MVSRKKEKEVGFGTTPTFTISKTAPAPKTVSKTQAVSKSKTGSQKSTQVISQPKPFTKVAPTAPSPKPAPSPRPSIEDIEGTVSRRGQRLTTKGRPVSEKKRREALRAAEGQQLTPRQRIKIEREGKRSPSQPTDKEREAAFKEALRGFVSGEITAQSLRVEAGARPGTSSVILKPAETASKEGAKKRIDAVFRELERRQITRERRAKLPLAARAILTLNETQADVIQAVEKIRGGELDQRLSNRTEKELRTAASSELKRILPQSQYVDFLADAGWDDILLSEIRKGPVSDKVVAQWILRRAAREEELILAGMKAGIVPLFSVTLPIRSLQIAKATSRTKAGVRKKFIDLIKKERGNVGITQADVNRLKRGSGRTPKATPETLRKITQLKERVDDAREAVPGKFDPATFDPFRKLAFEIADDPAKVVSRQRSLRKLIEKERPGAARRAAKKLARKAVPEKIDDLTQLRDAVGKAARATPVKKGALRLAPTKAIPEIRPGKVEVAVGEPVVEAVGIPAPSTVAAPGKAPSKKPLPAEKTVAVPKRKAAPSPAAKPLPQPKPGVTPAAQPSPKPGEKPAPRPATQPRLEPAPQPVPGKAPAPQPEKAVPQPGEAPLIAEAPPSTKPPTKAPTKVPVIPVRLPIRFKVKGKALPEGQFPRIVEWKQGFVVFRKDLVSGQLITTGTKQPGRPRDTLKVITTSRKRPRTQVEKLGIVNLVVTAVGLDFVSARRPKVGKIRRGFGKRRGL